MKKLLLIASAILVMFSITGCDPKTNDPGKDDGKFEYVDPIIDWTLTRAQLRDIAPTPFVEAVDYGENRVADFYEGYGDAIEYGYVFDAQGKLYMVLAVLPNGTAVDMATHLSQKFNFSQDTDSGGKLYVSTDRLTSVNLYIDQSDPENPVVIAMYMDTVYAGQQ